MSMRKDRLTWLVVGLISLAVAAAAYFVIVPYLERQTTLHIGDGVFKAYISDSAHYHQSEPKGMQELSENKAVITVYPHDAQWEIDMHDRSAHFDVVWLDEDKKVVHIVKNASSASKPDTKFRSSEPARYVVELRGGTVEQKSVNINSVAVFDEKEAEEAMK